MKIQVIGHAALLIEAAGLRILTDPWWEGPAYQGQWFPYPLPAVDPSALSRIDYIYISHGHEDHLHPPTLQRLPKTAAVVVPFLLEPGLADYIRSFGFARVIECPSGRKVPLRNGAVATCYNNEDDSMLVLEGDGEVLLNGNDALHADSAPVIDHLCRRLKRDFPRIDYMFMGYGGASWFPNCFRFTNGGVPPDPAFREFLFARNFARIARRLRPKFAFPFAASFVLLEKENRWINRLKFSVPDPSFVLDCPEVQAVYLMPGDAVDAGRVFRGPRRRPDPGCAAREIESIYKKEIAAIESLAPVSGEWIESFRRRLEAHAERKSAYILAPGTSVSFRIDLADSPGQSFHASVARGSARVTVVAPDHPAPIVLQTRSAILEAALNEAFGYESITIGCGARVLLAPGDFPRVAKVIALVSQKADSGTILGNYRLALRKQPARTCKYLYYNRHWLPFVLQQRWAGKKSNEIYSPDPARWNAEPYEEALREFRAAMGRWQLWRASDQAQGGKHELAV
ncbi:MAG TPA: MBL fold metallo-hydrolase [Candidatus Acidoferrales bacterium]|nr:MBL fold metallo-hydrolase [Candidatus Acidoferrales bacterium]